MVKSFNNRAEEAAERLYISAKGLQGRQSVRATFRLPEGIIQLLGIMARQLGIKQKSLFDQLIEDSNVLEQVASTMQAAAVTSGKRRQKTYVLSKRSLEILESVARHQDISRDLLVEISIQRLLPIMSAEQEKHRKRMVLYKKMAGLRKQCTKLTIEARSQLGNDDQASKLIRSANDALEENFCKLDALIQKGLAMEEYGEKGNGGQ